MQTHPMPYHELLAAIARPQPDEPAVCPVCRLVRKALLLWIEDLVYSFGVDPDVRREVRMARSLCSRHAHLLTEIRGMALGVSLIHLDVVDTVREEIERVLGADGHGAAGGPVEPLSLFARLRRSADSQRLGQSLGWAAAPQRSCLACEHQSEVELLYLQTLLRHLEEAELLTALRASPGLCLPHFRQAAARADDASALRLLARVQLECLGRLRDELAEFARKNDHRHLDERVGGEADAWIRSIEQVTGLRSVR